MANNYTQFSFALPPVEDGQRDRVKQWVADRHREMDTDEWWDKFSDVSLEWSEGDDSVWIHDGGESGDVEAAIYLVQSYLKCIDAPEHHGVYFGWANTCSKPRLNEFSGGGAVVTCGGEPLITGSYDCCRVAAELGIEIIAE